MLRFVLVQARVRPVRTIALGGAIAVASLSFVLLSATATTSDLRTRGSVETNFRNAYDILVRRATRSPSSSGARDSSGTTT